MSVEFDHAVLDAAEKIYTAEDMYRLGIEASTPGEGEEPDLVTAHKWFNLAASRGNELAREYRAQLTLEMTSREIAEAQRMARQWMAANRQIVSPL